MKGGRRQINKTIKPFHKNVRFSMNKSKGNNPKIIINEKGFSIHPENSKSYGDYYQSKARRKKIKVQKSYSQKRSKILNIYLILLM